MARTSPTDRRSVLMLAAGASLTALAGCTNLRISMTQPSGEHASTAFELGAHREGWKGLAPEQVEGDKNPILRMTPGDSIELTWRNLDGEPHQFVVENSIGERLVESAVTEEQGATRTLTFEAAQEMTTYLDPHHHVLMRGEMMVTTD